MIKGVKKKVLTTFCSPRALELRYRPEILTKRAYDTGEYMEEFSF